MCRSKAVSEGAPVSLAAAAVAPGKARVPVAAFVPAAAPASATATAALVKERQQQLLSTRHALVELIPPAGACRWHYQVGVSLRLCCIRCCSACRWHCLYAASTAYLWREPLLRRCHWHQLRAWQLRWHWQVRWHWLLLWRSWALPPSCQPLHLHSSAGHSQGASMVLMPRPGSQQA